MREINSKTKVFDVITLYPDVKDIMVKLGFSDIIKPGMLQSVGRIMTIEKGVKSKKMDWPFVKSIFKEYGYLIIREDENE